MTDKNTLTIFEWLRTCPALSSLWSIAAPEDIGVRVIIPSGTSAVVQYFEQTDAYGNYECRIVPYPSIYEDYQINCYDWYDVKDTNPPQYNGNVLTFEEVESVCKWVEEQNLAGNFPDISEKVIAVECNPFKPQVRYVNPDKNTIGYFITLRVRYVNSRADEIRQVEYDA